MKKVLLALVVSMALFAGIGYGQISWLDRPLDTNWNTGSGVVPNAPRNVDRIEGNCLEQVRQPESIADRAVTRAGWYLFGPSQTYGIVTLVTAMADVDGMCRPNNYNAFVFVSNRFVGTLSPTASVARSDGALGSVNLFSPKRITADFARYTSNDALCCPSQKSFVEYSITAGSRPVVKVDDVRTEKECRDDGGGVETQDNVVSGTVTYRQRSALPANAVLVVKIVDVSRADASAVVINEQRIDTAGKQVPIDFDITYDRAKIQERNRYAVQAEIRDAGGRLLFITDTSYPVITQGSPRSVEITLVPVGGGTSGGGQRSGVVRGTVTYLQRIALTGNADITVKLVDSGDPNGTPVSETTFSSANRQVPFPFELRYEPRDINRQRNYELQAEIKVDGKLRFKTESGKSLGLRGSNQTENVELIVTAVRTGAEPITGKTLSLSKFGTGSLKIGTRATQFLIRGSVAVKTDGTADVSVSSLDGTSVFSGKLT
ncbi:MAG: hypothetical protein HOP17_14710, partial [Acidobacteria bacterium]|nr:hypothetical protein [Acidobacteriota bacterium]